MISRNIWAVNGGCPGGPGHIIAVDSDIISTIEFAMNLTMKSRWDAGLYKSTSYNE